MKPRRKHPRSLAYFSLPFSQFLCCALVALLAITVAFESRAYAARAWEIVERVMVLMGSQAREAAQLLGLRPTGETLLLRWQAGSNARNCSYGLPAGDTSFPRCEDIQPPVNEVRFEVTPEPKLILRGSWNDESTGTGGNIDQYSVISPPLSGLEPESGWNRLAAALGNRKFAMTRPEVTPLVELRLHEVNGERRIVLTVANEPESVRKTKREELERCLTKYADLDGPPC